MIKGMSDFARDATDCQSTVVNHDSRNLGLDDETIDFIYNKIKRDTDLLWNCFVNWAETLEKIERSRKKNTEH